MITRRSLVKIAIASVVAGNSPARAEAGRKVLFGALTRAGHGGVEKPAGANGFKTGGAGDELSKLFNITGDGMVVPAANLAAPGDDIAKLGDLIFDNGDVWHIHTVPNTYSCGTGELQAILDAVPGSGLDGKTILGRRRADLCGAQPGSKAIFESKLTAASQDDLGRSQQPIFGLRITTEFDLADDGQTPVPAPPSERCNMRRAELMHEGLIKLDNITVSDSFDPASDQYTASQMWTWTKSAGRSQMMISDSEFFNIGVTDFDSLISGNKVFYSGKADVFEGDKIALFDKSGSKPLRIDDIPTDGTFLFVLRKKLPGGRSYAILQRRVISGVDGNIVTARNKSRRAFGRDDDRDMHFVICKTPPILGGIGQFGGIKSLPDLYIEKSKFHQCERAFTGVYNSLTIKNCVFDNNYADHISAAVDGNEKRFDIINNRFYRAGGAYDDLLNPHVDNVQLNTALMVTSNSVPYRINGNIMWHKGSRSYHAQGVFVSGTNRKKPSANIRVLVEIKHNIVLTKAVAGIHVDRPAEGSVIAGNTVLQDQNRAPPDEGVTAIRTSTSKVDAGADSKNEARDDGVLVAYNITPKIDFVTLMPTVKKSMNLMNKVFGGKRAVNGSLTYAKVLKGRDFDSAKIGDPDKVGDIDAILEAVTPKEGAFKEFDGIRIGANRGYFDYKTGEEAKDVPY
jgi:hypothetical protein